VIGIGTNWVKPSLRAVIGIGTNPVQPHVAERRTDTDLRFTRSG
jgi:hypothetical protein